ncbi:MAG TPA: DJ-1/PfpI family protein [Pusillimonas sp.]|jgi:transcriptional regulator GlxA family with amidase domain|nr:DJ-1/PfpI family protein [Pusillimonas sp.]HCN70364.1 DJ-1/PfpI family protein [Pusillimonas sp.]|tara:strand:- start:94345 stop:94983 length:639 start_codon:yes stop_codon:yes gene_type:complete
MRIAVVLYDFVEPIEIGILGTLSMARRVDSSLTYFTVSEHGGLIELQNGLRVETDYAFDNAPAADVVMVTGGPGWKQQVENEPILSFLRNRSNETACIASVCTGAMILAAAGLLDGQRATTKVPVIAPEVCPLDTLKENHPCVQTMHALVVDEGSVVTGGGVSLCVDLTLYLLERFLGEAVADETARIMEYQAARHANRKRLPVYVAQSTAP